MNVATNEKRTFARSSNLELLRIVSIILIIVCHTFRWGGETILANGGGSATLTTLICATKYLGEIGNGIFILITGYFLLRFKFSSRKFIKLVFETVFYTLGIFLIMLACTNYPFTTTDFLRAFFPHFLNVFWFINAYLIFYLLSPFFKNMVRSLNRNQLLFYMILIGAFLILMQLNQYDLFPIRLIGFIEVALIGSFLSQYPPKRLHKPISNVLLTCFFAFILFGVVIGINILGQTNNFFTDKGYFFCRFYDILVIPLCVSLFLTFKTIRMPANRCINSVAASSFGIYLIHENYFYRFYALPDIFLHYYKDNISSFLIICGLLIIVEFLVGLGLDQCTRRFIEKPLSRCFGKSVNRILDRIDFFMNQKIVPC